MPIPKTGEHQDDFISRCIPIVIQEGTTSDSSQAAAICHSKWNNRNKMKLSWEMGNRREFKFDPNSTENEGRFRLYPPDKLKNYIRIDSDTSGISYIKGETESGKSIIQAIRFDKNKFTESEAAQWWEENKDRFEFYEFSIEFQIENIKKGV